MRGAPLDLFSALIAGCGLLLLVASPPFVAAQDEHSAAEITSSEEAESLQSSATQSEHGAAEAAGEEDTSTEHASGHAAGHHDPFDLSHVNAAPMLEDPSELRSDLAIWTVVVFGCLLLLLVKFAWGPVIAGLDKRESAIADRIDEAKQSAEQAAQQLAQYEAKLAAAGEETRQLLAQARHDAEATAERIRTQAQQDAERERQRAVEDITNAKNVALQEMTQHSVDLATAMAGRMLQRQLNPEDHSQLIREALEQLPSRN